MSKKPSELFITDHMLLRVLQRLAGIDTEVIRAQLLKKLRPFAEGGATYAVIDGVRYAFSSDPNSDNTYVTTAIVGKGEKGWRSNKRYPRVQGRKE